MSGKPHTGIGGVFSSISVGIIGIATGIVLLPVIIATVGAAPYGIWLVLTSISAYLQYSDLGIGSAVVHFASRRRAGAENRTNNALLSAALLWNSAASALGMLAFLGFALWYVTAEAAPAGVSSEDASLLVILAAVSLGTIVLRPYIAILHGTGLLPVDRRNQAIALVVRFVGTIAAVFFAPNVVSVALVETIAAVIPSVLAVIAVSRRRLAAIEFSRETMSTTRYLLRYSLKSFTVAAVGALLLQSGTALSGILLGPSAATSYTAAFRIYSAVRQLLTWTIDPFRSMLSRLLSAPDARGSDRTASSFFRLVALLGFLGSALIAFSAEWFITVWLREGATPSIVATLIILMIGFSINSLQIPLAVYGDAYGKPGAFVYIQLSWLVTTVVLTFVLAPSLNIVGVAAALSAPLVIVVPAYIWWASKRLDLSIGNWWRRVLRPTLVITVPSVGLTLALGTLLIPSTGTFAASVIMSAAFTLLTAASIMVGRRIIRPEEFLRLLRENL